MSGQILVSSLFPTTESNSGVENVLVDWHTGDYDYDPIYPNALICPKLHDLQEAAYESDGWKAFNESKDAEEMEKVMLEDLGGADWMHILDCEMTSICTGRTLPDVINDFQFDGDDSMFSRLYRHSTGQLGYVYQFNDNEYAKLSMAPVVKEILETVIRPALRAGSR